VALAQMFLSSVPPPSLGDEIAAQDAAMFAAFNTHDLAKTMAFFSDDLEFYHDKDGLLSYAKVRDGFGRLFAQNNGLRRELVPGTIEVYPLPGLGALETGAHRSCHVENGKDDCGTFRFTLVWQKKDGGWRVTRALSYGH
jgi:ketosteroid isomerase-like protein